MELNDPLKLAELDSDDLKLDTILNADPELLSPVEFKLALKIIKDAQAIWATEEKDAAASGRKVKTSKGFKKVSPEQKKATKDKLANMDIDSLFGDLK